MTLEEMEAVVRESMRQDGPVAGGPDLTFVWSRIRRAITDDRCLTKGEMCLIVQLAPTLAQAIAVRCGVAVGDLSRLAAAGSVTGTVLETAIEDLQSGGGQGLSNVMDQFLAGASRAEALLDEEVPAALPEERVVHFNVHQDEVVALAALVTQLERALYDGDRVQVMKLSAALCKLLKEI